MMLSRLWRCRRGVTAVEFALVGPTLLLFTFGIIEAGLLFWMKGGLQSVAALTARCAAIGYVSATTTCTNATATQNYAIGSANTWIMPGVITAANITLTSAAATCNTVAGKFFIVQITSTYLASGFLPAPFSSKNVTVTACYAMA